MAVRLQLEALRKHPNLQQFLITKVRITGKQLGAGSYGSVEELEVGGIICAGKKIHETLIEHGNFGAENVASKYVEECQLMSRLRHPHLVQFLGVCFLPKSTLPVLVMERLLTSLDQLLEHSPDIPLSLKRSILADVARGLVYLHNHSPPVIHRDLSAKNVLLNSAMVAKISDLGNSRIINFQAGQLAHTLSRIPGTMVYMPPEAFEATSKYGPSLDCFSFGHLSLFTITQVFPVNLLPHTYRDPKNPQHLLGRTEVERRDKYIQLLHKQLGEHHPLVRLVKQCLDDQPSKRPSTEELLWQLESMKALITNPYEDLTKLDAMQMLTEKDIALREKNAALKEKDAALKEKDAALREKDAALKEKDAILREKDAALREKDAALREKEAILRGKDDALSKIASATVTQQTNTITIPKGKNTDAAHCFLCSVLRSEKDAALREKDTALEEKDNTLRKIVATVTKQINTMTDSKGKNNDTGRDAVTGSQIKCAMGCDRISETDFGLCLQCYRVALSNAHEQERSKSVATPDQQQTYNRFSLSQASSASGAIKCPLCSKPGHSRFLGLCETCYQQALVTGSGQQQQQQLPLKRTPVPLLQRQCSLQPSLPSSPHMYVRPPKVPCKTARCSFKTELNCLDSWGERYGSQDDGDIVQVSGSGMNQLDEDLPRRKRKHIPGQYTGPLGSPQQYTLQRYQDTHESQSPLGTMGHFTPSMQGVMGGAVGGASGGGQPKGTAGQTYEACPLLCKTTGCSFKAVSELGGFCPDCYADLYTCNKNKDG